MKKLIFCVGTGLLSVGCVVSAQMGNNANASHNANVRYFPSNGNVTFSNLQSNSLKSPNVVKPPDEDLDQTSRANLKTRYAVCGNPMVDCHNDLNWESYNLQIQIVGKMKMWDVFKSKPFYAVILSSKPVIVSRNVDDDNCVNGYFDNSELKAAQTYFRTQKVFANQDGCHPAQEEGYSYQGNDLNFLAVYAGTNSSQARSTLRRVKATGKYPNARIQRMFAEFCYGCH